MPTPLFTVESGVPNLDFILGGGIPEADTLLVIGAPGTGKTVLSFQVLFHQARAGRNVLYMSTVPESPLRLFRHLRTLTFFDDRLVQSQVFLLNIYSLVSNGLDQLPDAILQQIRAQQIQVVALIYPRFESTYVARDIPLGNERVAFGLPTLDALMEGGPFASGSIMVAGAVGTGKTLLSLQYLSEGMRQGEKCLFVGFRENPSELVHLARRIGIDLQPALDTGQLEIFHRAPVELLIDRVSEEMLQEVARLRPQRLVIDSIDEIERAVIPRERRWDYLTALAGTLGNDTVTTLLTREVSQVVGPELDFAETPLAELATNLILLRWVKFRGDLVRILSILKMKGSAFDSSIRRFVIEPGGFRVLPKVETAEGLLTGIARSLAPGSPRATRPRRDRDMT